MTINSPHEAASHDWEAAMHRHGQGLILTAATTLTGGSPVATGLVRGGRRLHE
jgi:hypothetical protein